MASDDQHNRHASNGDNRRERRRWLGRGGLLKTAVAAVTDITGLGTAPPSATASRNGRSDGRDSPVQARETELRTVRIEDLAHRYHTFVPPHTRGDRDFDGNGPSVDVYAYLTVRNTNELWATVYMKAEETEWDWTTASGIDSQKLWGGDDFGVEEIVSIDSDTFTRDSYTDTDHDRDYLSQPAGELVSYFSFTGDTFGDEAGTKTRVGVIYNPITVTIRQPKGPHTQWVEPDSAGFIPPHTRGDRDFDGNGPSVDVYAYLTVRNTNELWATVHMNAEETEWDWTTARGTQSEKVWDGDDFRVEEIVSIDSDTFTRDSYTDTDHDRDYLYQPAGDLVDYFACTGDTFGDDAGGYGTSVGVKFNPVRLTVRR